MKEAEKHNNDMKVFNDMESEVRSYCRSFRTVFTKAKNAKLWDQHGKSYIDFFAGAGALNYGHNDEAIRAKLVEYLMEDGVAHSLDMATKAKESFLLAFKKIILEPRSLDYKIMFPGPTGTNTVESALKTARKVTGRTNVICFTNAFHGMSLGSLAATGNRFKRGGAGMALSGTTFMPYDGYFGEQNDTAKMLEKLLEDPGSGLDLPAAVILETLQGEGGLNRASEAWLQKIEKICRKYGMLLIVDDVQMGCGRTGTFFSFEESGIKPDIVCLSKSIGGYGLPLALTLIKPEHDIWSPGEHNGTFRGNNLGFIAATEALQFWADGKLEEQVQLKAALIHRTLSELVADYPEWLSKKKGKGFIQGIAFREPELAGELCRAAFRNGLIMETSGAYDEVAKLMPPLTIETELLEQGLEIMKLALAAVIAAKRQELEAAQLVKAGV
jgi:diaminobutyrate-2-oxoglutarate transaminase